MRKTARIIQIIVIQGFLFLVCSCTPEACLEETEAYVKATFYSSATGKSVIPDSLTIYGSGMDTTFIYEKARGIRVANLPLNVSAQSSVFVVTINTLTDTLTILHTSYPHLISQECGYTWYHNIEEPSFTGNAIDSIHSPKRVITTFNEENIRIYF